MDLKETLRIAKGVWCTLSPAWRSFDSVNAAATVHSGSVLRQCRMGKANDATQLLLTNVRTDSEQLFCVKTCDKYKKGRLLEKYVEIVFYIYSL